jgi:phospholipid/cholesterol/gamma-HCH transport system substrate-binding protein
MKNNSGQQVKVGIFVTLGLVLSMIAIFLLGDISDLFQRRFTLFARFKEISGLRVGAPIFLAGLNVGKVVTIHFPGDLKDKDVMIRMEIQSAYRSRLREDSQANITTQGLLGDKAIFITVGSPETPELQNDSEIQVKQSLSLESFSEKGSEMLDNINKLADNVNKLVTDVKNKDSLMHALIYDPSGENFVKQVTRLVNSSEDIISQIKEGKGVLHALIYDPTRENVGEKFSKTIANMEAMSGNMKEVSSKIEKGEGSIGGLINDPTVYYDLMTLLGNANRNKLLRTVIRATLATNEKDLIDN